jgi:hypothetical protein
VLSTNRYEAMQSGIEGSNPVEAHTRELDRSQLVAS